MRLNSMLTPLFQRNCQSIRLCQLIWEISQILDVISLLMSNEREKKNNKQYIWYLRWVFSLRENRTVNQIVKRLLDLYIFDSSSHHHHLHTIISAKSETFNQNNAVPLDLQYEHSSSVRMRILFELRERESCSTNKSNNNSAEQMVRPNRKYIDNMCIFPKLYSIACQMQPLANSAFQSIYCQYYKMANFQTAIEK